MLLATQLERVFILTDKGQEIKLTDPEPKWSVDAVLNFYAHTYPILTTAKVSPHKSRTIPYCTALSPSWERKGNWLIIVHNSSFTTHNS